MSGRLLNIAAIAGAVVATLALAAQERVDPDPPPASSVWVVGDMHVHVSPPDAPGHSTLSVAKAIRVAQRNALDFVVMTPHDANRVLSADEWGGDRALSGQDAVSELASQFAGKSVKPPRRPLVVSGWEWTRDVPGHLGIAFVDVAGLDGVKPHARARRAMEEGALVVVNHPFFGPVESELPVMKMVKTDRRWRPFAGLGEDDGLWNAIEVWHDRSVWVEKMHVKLAEKYPATQMVRSALKAWDAATLTGRRRITAVGGSDAHGKLPYTIAPMPVVSVYVDELTEESLRRGLLAARVTFGAGGGVAARDFTATSDVEGERARIGDSLRAKKTVALAWTGKARLVENGADVGEFDGGAARSLWAPGAFAFWRIEKSGDAYSNMIYANLPE